jgi:hypothetical protein
MVGPIDEDGFSGDYDVSTSIANSGLDRKGYGALAF